MIRSKLFHAAGGFDASFFAHQEEIDLCWRIQLMGYRIFACPASVVYHVGGGTLPKGASRKTFLNFRNNQVMLAKNLPLSEKWWKIPLRLALDQVAAWKGLLAGDTGYFATIYKAHWAFAGWCFRKGKRITKNRKPVGRLEGVYRGLVIWDYFVRKRTTFRSIKS
jgi:GT2 family glycosyltransferase